VGCPETLQKGMSTQNNVCSQLFPSEIHFGVHSPTCTVSARKGELKTGGRRGLHMAQEWITGNLRPRCILTSFSSACCRVSEPAAVLVNPPTLRSTAKEDKRTASTFAMLNPADPLSRSHARIRVLEFGMLLSTKNICGQGKRN
jgi:hypothetical protein